MFKMSNFDNEITANWNAKSPTYWLVLAGGLFLGFLGVNGMLRPGPAAESFGLPMSDPQDYSYVQVKADRDLAGGALVFILLAFKMRSALRLLFLVFALEPLTDGILVLRHSKLDNRAKANRLTIHGSALVYLLLTVILMGRKNSK